jgi:hypothetical protein
MVKCCRKGGFANPLPGYKIEKRAREISFPTKCRKKIFKIPAMFRIGITKKS